MLQTKPLISTTFDNKPGPVGFFFGPPPQAEPTAQTLKWLQSVANQRATGDKMLVGLYRGHWVEITGTGEMLETYAARQLPDGSPPLFYNPITQARNHYSADVHSCTLRQHLEALFVYDPRGE